MYKLVGNKSFNTHLCCVRQIRKNSFIKIFEKYFFEGIW